MAPVTVLLGRAREGDPQALGDLVGQLYDELRAVARSQRRKLGAPETVNTTAVVHQAYANLEGRAGGPPVFTDRDHFFKTAATVMRGVIVDYARSQARDKRGGPGRPVSLGAVGPVAEPTLDVHLALAVDVALGQLAALDEQAARVVELRYFAGLSIDETGEALGVSASTVKRRWTLAQGWLYRRLADDFAVA